VSIGARPICLLRPGRRDDARDIAPSLRFVINSFPRILQQVIPLLVVSPIWSGRQRTFSLLPSQLQPIFPALCLNLFESG
jgi:hypothetical protein